MTEYENMLNKKLNIAKKQMSELEADNERLEKVYETCQKERKEWLAKACKGEKETEKYKKCFSMEQDLREKQLAQMKTELKVLKDLGLREMFPRDLYPDRETAKKAFNQILKERIKKLKEATKDGN